MISSYWRYAHAAAYSARINTRSIKQTSGIQNLDQDAYLAEMAPFPPTIEQRTISVFLDNETMKIDGLVAEQEKLIGLLAEKRQSAISHAVTKGLNTDALMKDSGFEWLGEVPSHWSLVQLQRLIQRSRRITYGIVQPGGFDETGRFMVRGQDYSNGWATPSSIFRVADSVEQPYKRSRLVENDLLMTIVGAGVGNMAVVPEWLEGANVTQTTARIAVDSTKADVRFVAAFFAGSVGRRNIDLYAKGAAQPGLNLEHVKIFVLTLPPLHEQRAIAAYLDVETAKLDALTAECERAIELLRERRAALISAAVTGQIDVRGVATEGA